MKKSYHIGGGFWAHVTWDAEGKRGVDHRGRKWVNINYPECELAWLESMCEGLGKIIQSVNKNFPA